jgi:hypothetical protein
MFKKVNDVTYLGTEGVVYSSGFHISLSKAKLGGSRNSRTNTEGKP